MANDICLALRRHSGGAGMRTLSGNLTTLQRRLLPSVIIWQSDLPMLTSLMSAPLD